MSIFDANKQIASRGWQGVQWDVACPEAVLFVSQCSKMKAKCRSLGHLQKLGDSMWHSAPLTNFLGGFVAYSTLVSHCCKLLLRSCILLRLKSKSVLSPAGAPWEGGLLPVSAPCHDHIFLCARQSCCPSECRCLPKMWQYYIKKKSSGKHDAVCCFTLSSGTKCIWIAWELDLPWHQCGISFLFFS